MGWYRAFFRWLADILRRGTDRLILWYQNGDDRPAILDVDEVMPELRRIDEGYGVIRQELMAVLPRTASIPRYHHVDPTQHELSSDLDGGWRTLFLYHQGAPEQPNAGLCPRTAEIVRGIPRVIDAFFSILEPRKSIHPHHGPSLANLRYHLALVVPDDRPPTMRVKDHDHTWKEGESLFFDDSHAHGVKNESDQIRVVLIVDVWRPLPLPLNALNLLAGWCARRGNSREDWLAAIREETLIPVEGGATP